MKRTTMSAAAIAIALLGVFASGAERAVKAMPVDVTRAKVIKQVTPTYPPVAKSARIEGVVRLTALVSEDGRVTDVRVVKGNRQFVPAAIGAMRQWRFEPATINGQPVKANYAAHFTFALQ